MRYIVVDADTGRGVAELYNPEMIPAVGEAISFPEPMGGYYEWIVAGSKHVFDENGQTLVIYADPSVDEEVDDYEDDDSRVDNVLEFMGVHRR